MKRIAIVAVMLLMTLAATARSVHYFTFSQASRTVSHLNAQNEMMIHCGYDYEIPTYVLVNEVWMERVNSAYYEIWVYGYDAYTGDEIYMPIDLQCVWLYSGNRMYNAAQYLRFHVSVVQPSFTWHIPTYNRYVRVVHRPGYVRTYHYEIHRHGWMPPAYSYGPGAPPPPLPYYYLRAPHQPAPMPAGAWTPGVNRPTVPTPATTSTRDNNPTTGTAVRSSHSTGRSNNSSTNRATNRGSGSATPASPSAGSSSRSDASTSRSTSSTSRGSASTTPTRASATSRVTGSTTATGRSTEATRSNTSPTRASANSVRNSSSRSTATPATPASSSSRSVGTGTTGSSRSSSTTTSSSGGNARSVGTSRATTTPAKSSTGTVSGSRGTRTTTR